jgi:hypothetical protein
MAKATFHKSQRVYVKPVGTWAVIERVTPHWAKGLDEPIRVFYDVGLGREFAGDELQGEQPLANGRSNGKDHWRIVRARNKSQPAEDCARHPIPGTFPVVVTGESEWGGWRVPGAEYDLDPNKVERQARLIANAPKLASVATELIEWAHNSGDEKPPELVQLARDARDLLDSIEAES